VLARRQRSVGHSGILTEGHILDFAASGAAALRTLDAWSW
jgi:hypothetical protein